MRGRDDKEIHGWGVENAESKKRKEGSKGKGKERTNSHLEFIRMSNRCSVLDVVIFTQHVEGAIDEIPGVEKSWMGLSTCAFVPAGVGFEGTEGLFSE